MPIGRCGLEVAQGVADDVRDQERGDGYAEQR
jgi:hypothetical protein